jgi:tetratricopeptide (TPR) repeat protein
MGEGRIDAAIETVRGIGDKPVFMPFVEYHLALLNDLAERPEAAEAAFKEAMDTQGGRSFRMVEAYGRFLERERRPDEARKLYTKALERLPNNPVILRAIERLDSGKTPPRLVNRPEEGLAEALYTAASALAQDRARESATIYLQLAVFARPDFELAYILLARQFESAGRWRDALGQYAKIDTDGPLGWEARFQIALGLERLDRLDEAVRLLRTMAAERGDDPAPIVLLGDLYRAREMYPEAAREYEAALDRTDPVNPEHWILYYSRGVAYERTERWSLAEADFLRALELEPDQPLVLNYLGYSWIEKGLNIHKAREMVERAVELRPNDGYVVDSLGWALYKLGKYHEAARHLERAVELRPQDPTINDHLGDAFWKVGRQIEARFQWRHALAFKPNNKLKVELRAKLRNGLGEGGSGS